MFSEKKNKIKMKKATPTPKEIANRRLCEHSLMKIKGHERDNVLNRENIDPEIKISNKKYHRKDLDIDHYNLQNPYIVRRAVQTFLKSGKRKKSTPEPFIMGDVHTVCDFDPTFYKIIEGRPLRRMDDIKVYMSNIRDIFLLRANASYLVDQIIAKDSSLEFEMAEYNKITNLFIQCKQEFVKFAKMSYHTANASQNAAEKIALQVKDMSEELDALGFNYVKLGNRITDLTITYETLTIYRHFLDKLTPLWVTTENINTEYLAPNNKYSTLTQQDSLLSRGSVDFDKIYKACLENVDPDPYFKNPKQLLDILEEKRTQSLNYLQLGVQSAKNLNKIGKCRDALKTRIENDAMESSGYVDIYNARIDALEEKVATYKATFYKILFGQFHELYASFDASKLYTCVQYVHTFLFGGMEDPRDPITTLMYNIERHYFQLSLLLDDLDLVVVNRARNQAYQEDIERMKKAYYAQRILREGDILSRALYASFEPPRRRQ